MCLAVKFARLCWLCWALLCVGFGGVKATQKCPLHNGIAGPELGWEALAGQSGTGSRLALVLAFSPTAPSVAGKGVHNVLPDMLFEALVADVDNPLGLWNIHTGVYPIIYGFRL
jgi:hypothetical protein